jgi:hypothetical protein
VRLAVIECNPADGCTKTRAESDAKAASYNDDFRSFSIDAFRG